MAQNDMNIANQGFPGFRADLNDALGALVSNSSGATAPATTFAHQYWVDTSANPSVLKIRNADNDAFITIGTINQTADTFTLTAAVSATTLNTSGAVVFNDAGANVDFRVEGDTDANLLFVDASADAVGIGTSSPAVKLDVATSSGTAGQVNKHILLTRGTTNGAFLSTERAAATNDVSALVFGVDSAERARITSNGQFLIGTTSVFQHTEKLAVENNSNTVIFAKQTGGADTFCQKNWNNATSGDNKFLEFLTEAALNARGSIDFNRGATLTRYNTTSDATLKNIIGDSDGQKSVQILNSTRIRDYAWKDDETQKPQIGVIAQELHETYKGAVSVGGNIEETIPAVTEQQLVSEAILDEDGSEIEAAVYETIEVEPERTETNYRPWGVDKTAFTFHLIAGWQAHEKVIKQQADMIAALEARIAALEAQ